jgi:tetratricopeptide (TPR) repeat protein
VYFSGGISRERKNWNPPAMSLLMETRRLGSGAKFNTWTEMQETWHRSGPVDGMGFVSRIFHGENPFGDNQRFATHYTGYLITENTKQVHLYTLSSDASFVLVNGQCVLSSPGSHGARATERTAPMVTIKCATPLTRIDYYHVKAGSLHPPSMVLGWHNEHPVTVRERRYHGYETVPSGLWAHAGTARVLRIEGFNDHPAPAPQEQVLSYIGYNNAWFYDVLVAAPPLPSGWTAEWEFSDGVVRQGATASRVLIPSTPQKVTLRLKHGNDTVTGFRRLEFPNDLTQASINRSTDVKRYAAILSQDDFTKLPPVAMMFLKEFGTLEQMARVADGFLKKNSNTASDLWAAAQEARIRWLAHTNAPQALAAVRSLPPRPEHLRLFNNLELDLYIYYLHDLTVASRVEALAGDKLRARLRLGDLFRLAGKTPQAIEWYRAAQQVSPDKTDGRKLPTQDRASSIAVLNALMRNDRVEAAKKLDEWEKRHPLAKVYSDFLLLRARTLMAFGHWHEALAELDSFQAANPESPYQIEVDFQRAHILFATGKADAARKLWADIAKNYPNHERAAESRDLAKQP